MRIAYGDLISGISGDMVVGALLDLGLPIKELKAELGKIPSLSFRIEVTKKSLHGIRATRFRVVSPKKEAERTWKQIRRLVEQSSLAPEVTERGLKIFGRLAEAEGKIHGVPPDKVHFHEVGATDSIVDIMATAIGTHYLNIESFCFSRIPLGRGLTRSRHGLLPLPGPATLELLKGLPVQWTHLDGETVTPTGAAVMAALGSRFGEAPRMIIERIGYGAGEREFPDRPNLFRLLLGQDDTAGGQDEMLIIETNIDDMNPEFYDYVVDRLFAAGARDVFLSPIQMKKNRPGTLLRIIAEPPLREKLAQIIFQETSTIGLRYYPVKRVILKRRLSTVKTRFGTVKLKVIEEPDGTKRATPEYEDLRRIAQAKKIPLKTLYDEVLRSFKA
ncbi:MAG: nickel pincer cofactor biosynthesis protein LarC [Candidatus Binatia bacterium]